MPNSIRKSVALIVLASALTGCGPSVGMVGFGGMPMGMGMGGFAYGGGWGHSTNVAVVNNHTTDVNAYSNHTNNVFASNHDGGFYHPSR